MLLTWSMAVINYTAIYDVITDVITVKCDGINVNATKALDL